MAQEALQSNSLWLLLKTPEKGEKEAHKMKSPLLLMRIKKPKE